MQYFFYKCHNRSPLILCKGKLDAFSHNGAISLNNDFLAFGFIILSDFNSNFNNFIGISSLRFYFSQLIRGLFDVPEYLNDSFKNMKIFFVRINSKKLATKFLLYCFLFFYFIVNISVTKSIFINFYCKFIVMKI